MILDLILCILCTCTLIVIAVVDYRTYEIPVKYNLFIGFLGVVRILSDRLHWQQYVLGFFAASSLFLVIYLITKGKGIGGGDVKLMAASGLFLGREKILLAMAIASVTALIVHTALMLFRKKGHTLAFGPYLSAGVFFAMVSEYIIRDVQTLP